MRTIPRMLPAIALVLIPIYEGALAQPAPKLEVTSSGRYLQHEDGQPFFYLADTAWDLFHRLTREEADLYLANRAEKGFTVIQAVVTGLAGDLKEPNAYGDLPFTNRDPSRPGEAYFEHIDYIVSRARDLGLYIGMLPSWGAYWKQVGRNAAPVFTRENARAYGEYLGRRYQDAPIIWILGGDQQIESEEERFVIDEMAAGLKARDGGAHLITYHPRGPGLSSAYVHDADWLDFNMVQSSHAAHDHDNGVYIENDYARQPAKPTLDGEPRYEHIQVGFYWQGWNRHDRFDDYDVRQAAYWALMSGACGHTYGHASVYQFWTPERDARIGAMIPWKEALDNPGAFQMGYVRRLFESRGFVDLVPDPDLLVNAPKTGPGKVRALRARDGSFAFVYSPRGEPFEVDKTRIEALRVREIWYDPRYGVEYPIHTGDNAGFQTYVPPTSGRGNDWVLILEKAEM